MDAAAKVTSKGQVTVPKSVRDALGITEGDEVVFRCRGQPGSPRSAPPTSSSSLARSECRPRSATSPGMRSSAGLGPSELRRGVERLRRHERPGPSSDGRSTRDGGNARRGSFATNATSSSRISSRQRRCTCSSRSTKRLGARWLRRFAPWSCSSPCLAWTQLFSFGPSMSRRPTESTSPRRTWLRSREEHWRPPHRFVRPLHRSHRHGREDRAAGQMSAPSIPREIHRDS